jgi:hypothetical protein
MPDDAATLVMLAVLGPGLPGLETVDGAKRSSELLVTRHDLDGAPIRFVEEREVPYDV